MGTAKKKRTKKRKRQRRGLYALAVLLFVLLLILLVLLYMISAREKTQTRTEEYQEFSVKEPEAEEVFTGLRGVETARPASVDRFGTYGVYLRLEGSVTPPEGKEISHVSLCFQQAYETRQKEEESSQFQAMYQKLLSGTEVFTTASFLNEGIVLDLLPEGEAVCCLRVAYTDETSEYLNFSDNSGMDPVDYYTLTRNGENRHIRMAFVSDSNGTYLSYRCEAAPLPDEVYDIVLDAGHGGRDTGAISGEFVERDLTFSYVTELKELLEKEGYKICLSRDGTEDKQADMAYMMYDENGRVNVACRSKAKLSLSIHFNSLASKEVHGIEIYNSSKNNTRFAKALADRLVEESGASYSTKNRDMILPGVYERTYTAEEIAKAEDKAAELQTEPLPRDLDTDYYFIIRELGELWTGAYVDGRGSTKYGENLFRDKNAGLESYLLELGYISNTAEIKNIVTNQSAYTKAIAESVTAWHDGLYDAQTGESQ